MPFVVNKLCLNSTFSTKKFALYLLNYTNIIQTPYWPQGIR